MRCYVRLAMKVPPTTEPQKNAESCCTRRPKRRGKDTVAYADLFKALADETRLSIIGLLASVEGELCVCEVEAHVGHLSQPTISHHLKLLRDAGLVTSERRGTWVHYAINKGAVSRLHEFVALLDR
jgi:ArsR family transcriptional regulator, arsenate/arsenite/antimonite-responsive transcriptional repressor